MTAWSPMRDRIARMSSNRASVRYTCGVGASGRSFLTWLTYPPRTRCSRAFAPSMWYGTSRNRLPSAPSHSCLVRTGSRSVRARAAGAPLSRACSTAMKCDLPEPNEPCR